VEQRISLVTLGVADVTRSRMFYERLGWQAQEVEETVFFQAGGLALVVWGRDKLAADAGLRNVPTSAGDFSGMTLAHNVRSKSEVDAIVAEVRAAGGTVTRPCSDTFYGGYAGYFTDPDGHAWEVAYNPGFPLAADGSITVPRFAEAAVEGS
jgi:predicted lactoylglutathione lyase